MATTKRSEWPKNTVILRLDSAITVEMRPLGLEMVLKCPNVPDFISALVVRSFKGESSTMEIDQFKQLGDFVDFLDECARLCLVHPTVVNVLDPDNDDQITPDMLTFEDKSFIFKTLGKSPRWLETFRDLQSADVQAGAKEPALPDVAEPDAEPEAAPAA